MACSGGLDSSVLARLVAEQLNLVDLFHVNYGFRGEESDEDEAFVRELAGELRCGFRLARAGGIDGLGEYSGSLQMKARDFRYSLFGRWKEQSGVDYVLTAHHLGDSLESLILNLSRGTGLKGLVGIPLKRDFYRRPLLFASREAIESYARETGQRWREDSSNEKVDYQRNFIRHRVIPEMSRLHPEFWQRVGRTLEQLALNAVWQEAQIEKMKGQLFEDRKEAFYIPLKELDLLGHRSFLLFELFQEFGFTDPLDIEKLLKALPGKRLESSTHLLQKDRNHLILHPLISETETKRYDWKEGAERLEMPLKLRRTLVDRLGNPSNERIYVDSGSLEFPLWIRKWKEGDYFYPFGMRGSKKVSKFLKDERVPYVEKSKIYVLGSGDRIVWVVGMRLDDRFKVTENTSKILCIEWLRNQT